MKSSLALFKKHADTDLFLTVEFLLEQKLDLLLQKAINLSNGNVVEDGIVGYRTLDALLKIDKYVFFDNIAKLLIEKEKHIRLEDRILEYLGRAEGTVIHWNRRESAYTSPYGVYKKSFPNSKIIKYIDSLFKKYALRETPGNAIKLNYLLSNDEKEQIRILAYAFYVKHFLDKKLNAIFEEMKFYNSALTFFSNSVNGGKARGVKVLQKALKLKADGILGKKTRTAVRTFKGSDEILNQLMLAEMYHFYNRLIKNNPKRYARFKRGWYNRLKNLGFRYV